jgi:hypothetical protein
MCGFARFMRGSDVVLRLRAAHRLNDLTISMNTLLDVSFFVAITVPAARLVDRIVDKPRMMNSSRCLKLAGLQ